MNEIRIQHLKNLELDEFATDGEIKSAYRDLVKIWHPDRYTHDERLRQRATAKIKQLNESYEWLKANPIDHINSVQHAQVDDTLEYRPAEDEETPYDDQQVEEPSLTGPIVLIIIGVLIFLAEKDKPWQDEPWMYLNGALVVGVPWLIIRLLKRSS